MLNLEALDNFFSIGNASARVAILGIGNELSGDDAAGVRIARDLAARIGSVPGCLVLDTGTAPENFTGALRQFRPDSVLLVDAADSSSEPGSVDLIDWQETDGLTGSTHTLPPSVLARFLTEELGCRLALLVVQPAQLEFNAPLSPAVERSAQQVVEALARAVEARK